MLSALIGLFADEWGEAIPQRAPSWRLARHDQSDAQNVLGLVPMPSISVDGDGARRTSPRFAGVSAGVSFHAFIERGDSTEARAAPVPARFEELFRSP